MHCVRRHRRAVSLLAVLLLALQPLFALAAGAYAASNPTQADLISCTEHGIMYLDADGNPQPAPDGSRPLCPCCVTGCLSTSTSLEPSSETGALGGPIALLTKAAARPQGPPPDVAETRPLATSPRGPPLRA